MKSVQFGSQVPGLNDSTVGDRRLRRPSPSRGATVLPRESEDLWEALLATFDSDTPGRAAGPLRVAQGVNAVHEAWNRRPRALAHADRLAQAVELDMAVEGWTPTVDNYPRPGDQGAYPQQAVSGGGRGKRAADRIAHLKKGEMAERGRNGHARRGSGWLPEPLRTPGRVMAATVVTVRARAQ